MSCSSLPSRSSLLLRVSPSWLSLSWLSPPSRSSLTWRRMTSLIRIIFVTFVFVIWFLADSKHIRCTRYIQITNPDAFSSRDRHFWKRLGFLTFRSPQKEPRGPNGFQEPKSIPFHILKRAVSEGPKIIRNQAEIFRGVKMHKTEAFQVGGFSR